MPLLTFQGVEYQQLLDDLRALVRHELAQVHPSAGAPHQPAADELLTVSQAAALLDVCVATVHEWKRRGVLAYRKVGGRAYLSRADVLAAGSREQRTQKPSRPKGRPPA